MSNAKLYNKIKLLTGISETVIFLALVLVFVLSGLSDTIYKYASGISENEYIRLIIFAGIAGGGVSVLFSPFSFFSGYYIEHKFSLSNQSLLRWFTEGFKSVALSIVIGIPVLLAFYYFLNISGDFWWVYFGAFLFFFSVLLAKIAPVFILPLFYKILPLEDAELKAIIAKLGKDAGINVENVYSFDMSKNTKKANAAFTGLGKSKKVILGDTLLEKFGKDEIETVLAHEFGHYKFRHIPKGIFISTITSFLTLYVISVLYSFSVQSLGFESITNIAALPLLLFWSAIISILTTPISNIISRKFEYEADNYAVTVTGKSESFIAALEKLTEQNLGDPEPHPFVEWFFYSHPSIKNRVKALDTKSI
ncbi:MAG: M48 family metallopeptidase [Ignavibacteriaceae bacterium]|nr:M48 family metallopeptidase [Ignavibacteriaceae bacterium]